MQECQVYIENNARSMAFAGSVGTTDNVGLQLIFDVVNVKDMSFIFDLVFDKIEQGVDQHGRSFYHIMYVSKHFYDRDPRMRDDTFAYFRIYDDGEIIIDLNYEYDYDNHTHDLKHAIFYHKVDDPVQNRIEYMRDSGEVPYLIKNGTMYIASNIGVYSRLCRSKFIDAEGNIVTDQETSSTYAKDAEAVRQYLLQHLAVIKHELWYNYEYGLPLFQKGLTKAMIDAEVVSIIYQCPQIESILDYTSYVDDNNQYHLSFSLLTKYGKLDMIDTL